MRGEAATKTIAAVVFAILLIFFIARSEWPSSIPSENFNQPPSVLADFLFLSFGPGFMLVGLLLVIAILAAVYLAKQESPS